MAAVWFRNGAYFLTRFARFSWCNSEIKWCQMSYDNGAASSGTNKIENRKDGKMDARKLETESLDMDILKRVLKDFSQKELNILIAHNRAVKANEDTYIDQETGYSVCTEKMLQENKECCGNECRHCPYGHINVPENLRKKKFNSLFYV